jgi:hypothetical protein
MKRVTKVYVVEVDWQPEPWEIWSVAQCAYEEEEDANNKKAKILRGSPEACVNIYEVPCLVRCEL